MLKNSSKKNTQLKDQQVLINSILDKIATRQPEHKDLIDAFREAILAQEALILNSKTNFNIDLGNINLDNLKKNIPLFNHSTLALEQEFLKEATKKLSLALAKGMPQIKTDLNKIYKSLENDPEKLEKFTRWSWGQNKEQDAEINEFCSLKKINPEALLLLMQRVLKSAACKVELDVAEKMQSSIATQDSKEWDSAWNQGLCPVCGSQAQLSLIKGKDGQRFLVCGLCSHEWRYSRTACVYCGIDTPKNITWHFLEEHKAERAELCESCRQYVLSVDTRERPEAEQLPFLQTFGMLYLDILMQDKT